MCFVLVHQFEEEQTFKVHTSRIELELYLILLRIQKVPNKLCCLLKTLFSFTFVQKEMDFCVGFSRPTWRAVRFLFLVDSKQRLGTAKERHGKAEK